MKKRLFHKKRLVFDIVGVSVLIAGIYFIFQSTLELKKDSYIIEYGESVSLDAKDYLDFGNKAQETVDDILADTQVQSNLENEKGKDYPSVGDYQLIITYKHEKETVDIKVHDTTAPQILTPESIQVLVGEELNENDFENYFDIQDFSQASLKIDFSSYDSQKIGKQNITLTAIDIYKNEVKMDYQVETVEKPNEKYYDVKQTVQKDDSGVVTKVSVDKIEKKFTLNVPIYCQHDVGARMGCDPSALYQALRYKGYCQDVSLKKFILDMPIAADNDPRNGFAGSPWTKGKASILETIYPSAMAKWAQKYGNVSDFSGHSVTDIIEELRKGNAVMIYATHHFDAPEWQEWSFGRMYNNIHCLTMSGYDPINSKIRVTDPGASRSSYWVDLDVFTLRYNYKKFAILVE